MKTMLRAFALLLILCLTAVPALAAGEISFEGTVASDASVRVAAPIGGTVDTVNLIAGQRVTEDDAVLSLAGTKVYAAQSGTVTGVFAAAETIWTPVATATARHCTSNRNTASPSPPLPTRPTTAPPPGWYTSARRSTSPGAPHRSCAEAASSPP